MTSSDWVHLDVDEVLRETDAALLLRLESGDLEAHPGGRQMNDLEFVRLTYEVRKSQKRYFRSRSAGDLEAARELERQLDAAIEERLKPRPPGLFDGPDWRGDVQR